MNPLVPRGVFVAVLRAFVIFSVDVAVPEPGLMVAGENEQTRFVGRKSQESAMLPLLGADCDVAVTVTCPDLPLGIVSAAGEAVNHGFCDEPEPGAELQAGL